MSAPTPKEARTTLAAQITALGLSGVTVYDHEPPAVTAGISVTVSTASINATEWLIGVHVYVSDTVPETAQDDLDSAVVAVDGALSPAPRGDWQFGYDEDRTVFIASTTVAYPREDF